MIPTIIATLPRFIAKHYKSLAFALLALFALYQRHQAHKWHDKAMACQTASQTAAAQTKAMREQERARYQEQAHETNQTKRVADAYVRTATDRYAASRRVRTHDLGPALPIGQATDAGKPADVPETVVMVAEPDVQRAAEWQSYGVACHAYLLKITGN